MKTISTFLFSFFSTFFHLTVFGFMLVMANVVAVPLEDAGAFYRYLASAAVFSVYVAGMLACLQRQRFPSVSTGGKCASTSWLVSGAGEGGYRINPIGSVLLAVFVFSGLILVALVLSWMNAAFELTTPIELTNPYLLITFAVVAIMVGVFAPWVYKLEFEYRSRQQRLD